MQRSLAGELRKDGRQLLRRENGRVGQKFKLLEGVSDASPMNRRNGDGYGTIYVLSVLCEEPD